MAQGFHIDQDRTGARIGGEVVQQIAKIHVGHVTHGDDVRETDVAGAGPIDDTRYQGSRLR